METGTRAARSQAFSPQKTKGNERNRPHRTRHQGEQAGDPVRPLRRFGVSLWVQVCVDGAPHGVEAVAHRRWALRKKGQELLLVSIAPSPRIESDELVHDGTPPRAAASGAAPCSVRRYARRPRPFVVGSMRGQPLQPSEGAVEGPWADPAVHRSDVVE